MLDKRGRRVLEEQHVARVPSPSSGALQPSAARARPPSPRRVMIVDDDDAIREALEDVLGDEGYEVMTMSDGKQALDHLRRGAEPHAIVVDLWMPIMDGWKFLDELLADGQLSQIPIVVLTAVRDQRARELGVAEVLTKPVQLHQVLDTLERLTQACVSGP